MATQTTNLHLIKPGYNETADVADTNTNMDIIDTAVAGKAAKSEAVKNITRTGTTFTATRADNTSFTFTQQDTTYSQISRGSSAGLAPGLPSGSGTSKYLREDGSWQTPPDNNTTYSAASGGGLSLNGTAFSIANSGVTAGSYGPSANATPGYGNTFNVPYVTVDAKGRVTAASTKTVKIPASDNTWRGFMVKTKSVCSNKSITANDTVGISWSEDVVSGYTYCGSTFYSDKDKIYVGYNRAQGRVSIYNQHTSTQSVGVYALSLYLQN